MLYIIIAAVILSLFLLKRYFDSISTAECPKCGGSAHWEDWYQAWTCEECHHLFDWE